MLQNDFFKVIDSELKAYLLGFIVADGSINIRTRYRKDKEQFPWTEYSLSFSLHNRDTYIFELFRDNVNSTMKMGRSGEYIRFQLYGKEFVEEIVKFGYLPNKTYSEMNLPNISKEFLKDFIRGYFDGDGTCTANIVNEKGYRRVKAVFHIFSKKKNILLEIQSYLRSISIIVQLYYMKSKDGYLLKTCKRSTIKQLYDLFYDNTIYYFKRKKITFENAMIIPSKFRELKDSELCNA